MSKSFMSKSFMSKSFMSKSFMSKSLHIQVLADFDQSRLCRCCDLAAMFHGMLSRLCVKLKRMFLTSA
jgi:hypothetical protein